ncbi:thiosulfate sulfurtransferase GlpE [Alcanivorax sp. S6407]|uniref:thiosulfate sulfurtransferase GlpE n=1 Tax=Alcanivorax sp. S6407 TaxID=2926424 RepID=UPI001FF22E98|nr:thiosulfate sulfurtransferase GlpE [Alcanivorax sp. S6407]MCK0153228.1 thiosulfate sulfurtransferase GlpE [Alcanivorax sp. S6407]
MPERISPVEAKARLDAGDALFVDVRDPHSFAAGHLRGAAHLSNANLDQFLADTDPTRPLVVYCYHGHSSQGAADFLMEKGYQAVSMDGGYEVFKLQFPETLELPDA